MHYLYAIACYLGLGTCVYGLIRLLIVVVKSKEDTKKYTTAFGVFIILGIAFFFGGKYFWTPISSTQSTVASAASDKAASKKIVAAGQKAILNKDGFAATTKSLNDELVRYAVAGNGEAIQQMIARQQVLSLPKGTHVNVVDRTTGTAEIEVIDGNFAGKRAFVIIEDLNPSQ
jgi:hypothetical protein